ncbi:MAG TPA: glucose 1-dehydrogenase [Nitrospirae bacterium]|nr:glucose 1-dehydrogenase [Nitrospirota bacterium]
MVNEKNRQLLRDKVAVVTGGGGDIGLAMAKALGDAGARIVLASRDRERLGAAAESISVEQSRILTLSVDVTDNEQVELLMRRTVEKFGQIDVLVTAAGIQLRKPAMEFSREDWDSVLNTNLSGAFFCCQEAAKHMIEQKSGKIIMVSSLTAEIGIPDMAAYVAGRGAIKQLSKALAVEWAKHGINVNCIGPGRFRTKMTEDVFADDEVRNSFMELIPMGRAGRPSDLAGLTVFLASGLSDYITGQSIYVDGGWLASGGSSKR